MFRQYRARRVGNSDTFHFLSTLHSSHWERKEGGGPRTEKFQETSRLFSENRFLGTIIMIDYQKVHGSINKAGSWRWYYCARRHQHHQSIEEVSILLFLAHKIAGIQYQGTKSTRRTSPQHFPPHLYHDYEQDSTRLLFSFQQQQEEEKVPRRQTHAL